MKYLSRVITLSVWMVIASLAVMAGYAPIQALLITISLSIAETISIYLHRKEIISLLKKIEVITK